MENEGDDKHDVTLADLLRSECRQKRKCSSAETAGAAKSTRISMAEVHKPATRKRHPVPQDLSCPSDEDSDTPPILFQYKRRKSKDLNLLLKIDIPPNLAKQNCWVESFPPKKPRNHEKGRAISASGEGSSVEWVKVVEKPKHTKKSSDLKNGLESRVVATVVRNHSDADVGKEEVKKESRRIPCSSSLHKCEDPANCQSGCVAKGVLPGLDHMSDEELMYWFREVTGTTFVRRTGEKVRGKIRRVIRAEAKRISATTTSDTAKGSRDAAGPPSTGEDDLVVRSSVVESNPLSPLASTKQGPSDLLRNQETSSTQEAVNGEEVARHTSSDVVFPAKDSVGSSQEPWEGRSDGEGFGSLPRVDDDHPAVEQNELQVPEPTSEVIECEKPVVLRGNADALRGTACDAPLSVEVAAAEIDSNGIAAQTSAEVAPAGPEKLRASFTQTQTQTQTKVVEDLSHAHTTDSVSVRGSEARAGAGDAQQQQQQCADNSLPVCSPVIMTSELDAERSHSAEEVSLGVQLAGFRSNPQLQEDASNHSQQKPTAPPGLLPEMKDGAPEAASSLTLDAIPPPKTPATIQEPEPEPQPQPLAFQVHGVDLDEDVSKIDPYGKCELNRQFECCSPVPASGPHTMENKQGSLDFQSPEASFDSHTHFVNVEPESGRGGGGEGCDPNDELHRKAKQELELPDSGSPCSQHCTTGEAEIQMCEDGLSYDVSAPVGELGVIASRLAERSAAIPCLESSSVSSEEFVDAREDFVEMSERDAEESRDPCEILEEEVDSHSLPGSSFGFEFIEKPTPAVVHCEELPKGPELVLKEVAEFETGGHGEGTPLPLDECAVQDVEKDSPTGVTKDHVQESMRPAAVSFSGDGAEVIQASQEDLSYIPVGERNSKSTHLCTAASEDGSYELVEDVRLPPQRAATEYEVDLKSLENIDELNGQNVSPKSRGKNDETMDVFTPTSAEDVDLKEPDEEEARSGATNSDDKIHNVNGVLQDGELTPQLTEEAADYFPPGSSEDNNFQAAADLPSDTTTEDALGVSRGCWVALNNVDGGSPMPFRGASESQQSDGIVSNTSVECGLEPDLGTLPSQRTEEPVVHVEEHASPHALRDGDCEERSPADSISSPASLQEENRDDIAFRTHEVQGNASPREFAAAQQPECHDDLEEPSCTQPAAVGTSRESCLIVQEQIFESFASQLSLGHSGSVDRVMTAADEKFFSSDGGSNGSPPPRFLSERKRCFSKDNIQSKEDTKALALDEEVDTAVSEDTQLPKSQRRKHLADFCQFAPGQEQRLSPSQEMLPIGVGVEKEVREEELVCSAALSLPSSQDSVAAAVDLLYSGSTPWDLLASESGHHDSGGFSGESQELGPPQPVVVPCFVDDEGIKLDRIPQSFDFDLQYEWPDAEKLPEPDPEPKAAEAMEIPEEEDIDHGSPKKRKLCDGSGLVQTLPPESLGLESGIDSSLSSERLQDSSPSREAVAAAVEETGANEVHDLRNEVDNRAVDEGKDLMEFIEPGSVGGDGDQKLLQQAIGGKRKAMLKHRQAVATVSRYQRILAREARRSQALAPRARKLKGLVVALRDRAGLPAGSRNGSRPSEKNCCCQTQLKSPESGEKSTRDHEESSASPALVLFSESSPQTKSKSECLDSLSCSTSDSNIQQNQTGSQCSRQSVLDSASKCLLDSQILEQDSRMASPPPTSQSDQFDEHALLQHVEPPSKLLRARKTISPTSRRELLRASSSGIYALPGDSPPQKLSLVRLKDAAVEHSDVSVDGLRHSGGRRLFSTPLEPSSTLCEREDGASVQLDSPPPSSEGARLPGSTGVNEEFDSGTGSHGIVQCDSSYERHHVTGSSTPSGTELPRKISLSLSPTLPEVGVPSARNVDPDLKAAPAPASGPSPKGILKPSPQSCKGLCKCPSCSEGRSREGKGASEFIAVQMKAFMHITRQLTREVQGLRTLVETHAADAKDPKQVEESLQKSRDVELSIDKNVIRLLRDSRRMCKLISAKSSVRRIVFADEAGKDLCQVKTFETQSPPGSILNTL